MKLKQILREYIEEATYPNSFNMKEFIALPSYKARIQYANATLKRLGSGSSRIVYQIDKDTVLKLAKNKKGIAQNKVEINFNRYGDVPDVIAKVYEHDKKSSLWLEMELATKITESIFKKATGITFNEFSDAMHYFYYTNVKPSRHIKFPKPENYDEMWENEFVSSMLNFMGEYKLPVGDLIVLSAYGAVYRQGNLSIILVDYGADDDVLKTYYTRR